MIILAACMEERKGAGTGAGRPVKRLSFVLQVRDYRDLEQMVSSSAENWSNCGYEGTPNKICWYIRCSGKQRTKSKVQGFVLDDWRHASGIY